MKMMKVFDPYDMDRKLNEALHEFGSECHGLPNDCYFHWFVDDSDGGGYMEEETAKEINQWLKDHGAEKGETVLIERCW